MPAVEDVSSPVAAEISPLPARDIGCSDCDWFSTANSLSSRKSSLKRHYLTLLHKNAINLRAIAVDSDPLLEEPGAKRLRSNEEIPEAGNTGKETDESGQVGSTPSALGPVVTSENIVKSEIVAEEEKNEEQIEIIDVFGDDQWEDGESDSEDIKKLKAQMRERLSFEEDNTQAAITVAFTKQIERQKLKKEEEKEAISMDDEDYLVPEDNVSSDLYEVDNIEDILNFS